MRCLVFLVTDEHGKPFSANESGSSIHESFEKLAAVLHHVFVHEIRAHDLAVVCGVIVFVDIDRGCHVAPNAGRIEHVAGAFFDSCDFSIEFSERKKIAYRVPLHRTEFALFLLERAFSRVHGELRFDYLIILFVNSLFEFQTRAPPLV